MFTSIGCHNAYHGAKSTYLPRGDQIKLTLSGHNLTESIINCVVERVSLRIFLYIGLPPTGISKFRGLRRSELDLA